MICTRYRAQARERATRSFAQARALPLSALAAATLALGACSQTPPVPPSRLAPPPAELMADPAPLEPIPACEGGKACRTRYYARSRAQHGAVADQVRGLQRWARVSTSGR